MRLIPSWLRRPRPSERASEPDPTQPMDLGPDPLDPHGDGTLRPGDPMWEAAMSGQSVLANRREDGRWDVRRFDTPGPPS